MFFVALFVTGCGDDNPVTPTFSIEEKVKEALPKVTIIVVTYDGKNFSYNKNNSTFEVRDGYLIIDKSSYYDLSKAISVVVSITQHPESNSMTISY